MPTTIGLSVVAIRILPPFGRHDRRTAPCSFSHTTEPHCFDASDPLAPELVLVLYLSSAASQPDWQYCLQRFPCDSTSVLPSRVLPIRKPDRRPRRPRRQ